MLKRTGTGKLAKVKPDFVGTPDIDSSQQLLRFNPQMVSDPRQKHYIVSTRCWTQYIHMGTYNSW